MRCIFIFGLFLLSPWRLPPQPPAPPDTLNVRVAWAAVPPSTPVDVTFPIRRGVGPFPMWEGSHRLTAAQHPSGKTIHVRWYQTLDPRKPHLDITCYPNGFNPTLVRPLDNPSILVPVQLGYTEAKEGVGSPAGPVALRYWQHGVAWGMLPEHTNPSLSVLHGVVAKGGAITLVEVYE